MFVSPQDPFSPGEGRDQHQQRGFWQVEIRQHGADDMKLESRIDEDVGLATLRRDAAIFILSHSKLQCAYCRCPYSHHTPSGITRSLNSPRDLLGDFVPLMMQFVLLHHLLAHRLK